LAIAEILIVTPEMDELIASDAPRSVMQKQMRADGFQSMAEDGIAKVLKGDISLDSLRRAVDLTRIT
jgi:type II secretory ATPase GspE/PulE/Tfp pilus assembly ATPase PilB-like protein